MFCCRVYVRAFPGRQGRYAILSNLQSAILFLKRVPFIHICRRNEYQCSFHVFILEIKLWIIPKVACSDIPQFQVHSLFSLLIEN